LSDSLGRGVAGRSEQPNLAGRPWGMAGIALRLAILLEGHFCR
jgi:hypothetical protein